jgi:hypothetical protein
MDEDDTDAALAQQQLEERRQWDAHHQALRDFRQWQNGMESEWDRIERELREQSCKA